MPITEVHAKKVLAAIEALKAARAHRKEIYLKPLSVKVTLDVQRSDSAASRGMVRRLSSADADFGKRVVALLRRDADDSVTFCEQTLRQLDCEIPPEAPK